MFQFQNTKFFNEQMTKNVVCPSQKDSVTLEDIEYNAQLSCVNLFYTFTRLLLFLPQKLKF